MQTHERILKETWRLMEEKRGQGVRVEDIAQAAGVSRQAVYLHFGTRTELLIQTARYVDKVMGLEERLKPVLEEQSGVGSLDAFVEFWGNYIPVIYGLAKVLRQTCDTDEAARAAWDDRMEDLRNGCRQVVKCLRSEGTLGPGWKENEAEDMLWSMLALEVWEDMVLDRGWTTEEYVTAMQRALRGAFVGIRN